MRASFLAWFLAGALLPLLAPAAGGRGQVTGIAPSNGSVRVSFATSPGVSYQLQRNDQLGSRWWGDSGAAVTATAAQTVSVCAGGASCAFFRVLEFTNSVFWYDWSYRFQAPQLSAWGLGTAQTSYGHTDRAYDWFIDQQDTGAANGANCGPSSVTMALKWRSRAFAKTAAEARNWSYSWRANGWWYTSDITSYLTLHAAPNLISTFTGAAQLTGLISEGKLVILCIDTTYLTRNTNGEERTGRFYAYGGGHFLVVKGSRTVSGTTFFEVYDPNTWHAAYSDGTPKGRNRHVKASDLAASIQNWWNYIIVVSPPAGGGGAPMPASEWVVPVDPLAITHASGM